jgi:predicted CopG family antitoxin
VVRHRTITVSEDVYRRLSKLAAERNKSMSDLIRELLDNHEGGVDSGVVERLGRIEAMLRDCLDRLDIKQSVESKPVGAGSNQAEAVPIEAKSEVGGDSAFEDNPWIQILRVRYGSQNA